MDESYKPSLTPNELGAHISALGVKKANTRAWQQQLLGMLAGLYIAFGAQAYLAVLASGGSRLSAAVAFSVGLVLVIIAGAELFTGNVIMIVGGLTGLYPFRRVVRSWGVVYLGNLMGAVLAAVLVWHSGLLGEVDALNEVGSLISRITASKMSLSFMEAFIRGIFCNILVILAILMATMAKDVVSKVICCVLPIATFVVCGFEHCVANMYFLPLGLLADGSFAQGQMGMWQNLLPVTLGNIVGGVLILVIHPNRLRQLHVLLRSRRASRVQKAG
jgi:formate/nitrite transporter